MSIKRFLLCLLVSSNLTAAMCTHVIPCIFQKTYTINYFLRVIPTLTHYSDIVFDILSGRFWKYTLHIYIYT